MSQQNTKVKIGPRINEDLWDDFREAVEEKHGRTRTFIAVELENAIEAHLNDDEEDRIEEIEAQLEEIAD